jgi:succinylarginine dihydrolase
VTAREYNFDGLVGPTHNYSGLSFGNVASQANSGLVSNPRAAALQGLAKAKALADRGFAQGVLPPLARPDFALLHRMGFGGTEAQAIGRAARQAPALLSAAYSSSSMWTANAATVSASADTADARVHFTPANLVSKLHRSVEPEATARVLAAIFPEGPHFAHHAPLPASPQTGDEGAANHTRLCPKAGEAGVEFFVYGASGFDTAAPAPRRFPARQTREASEAVARLHGLDSRRTVFAQQHPDAIDAGVFHNDVIAVGSERVLFCHERAFLDRDAVLRRLREAFPGELEVIEVPETFVTLADAVETYLFNSQLLARPDGTMLLVVPEECRRNERVARYLEGLATPGGTIREVLSFDLRESMRNGGGPACLRLRVELTDAEARALHPGVILDEALYGKLTDWVRAHYRDRLSAEDLADPTLAVECREALDALAPLLGFASLPPAPR